MLLFFPREAQVFVCLHKKHCFLFLVKLNFLFECEKDFVFSHQAQVLFVSARNTVLIGLELFCLCASNTGFPCQAQVSLFVCNKFHFFS